MSEKEIKIIEMAFQMLYQSVEALEGFEDFYGKDIKNEIFYTSEHLGEILNHKFDF